MDKDKNIYKLDNIAKKEPFGAPEGYFEALPDRVMSKLEHGKSPTIDRAMHSARFKMVWGIAASLVVLLTVWLALGQFKSSSSSNDMEKNLTGLSNEDILDYLEFGDWSQVEILEAMSNGVNSEDEDSILPFLDLEEEEIDNLVEFYDNLG